MLGNCRVILKSITYELGFHKGLFLGNGRRRKQTDCNIRLVLSEHIMYLNT